MKPPITLLLVSVYYLWHLGFRVFFFCVYFSCNNVCVRISRSSEATTFGYSSSLGDQASRLCEQLRTIAASPHRNGTVSQPDPRLSVQPGTRDFLIDWLAGDPRVSSQRQAHGDTIVVASCKVQAMQVLIFKQVEGEGSRNMLKLGRG